MTKYAYLVCVDPINNNNKFYEMIDNGNGTFSSFNGRVDVTRVEQKPKSISEWDKTIREKNKKGYKDMTSMKSVTTVVSTGSSATISKIKNNSINELFELLQSYANNSITTNYSVKAVDVTQAQVDKAQSVINQLVAELQKDWRDTETINRLLVELYTVIPRKMKKVIDHIFQDSDVKHDRRKCLDVISKEQETLDVMAQQVQQSHAVVNDSQTTTDEQTVLDKLGLVVQEVTADELRLVRSLMQGQDNKLHKVFKVINTNTQRKFDLAKSIENKTEMFWHGSRNQNWLSILQNGLMIRPSNAIHTGAMFDSGIYFASSFRKSLGYTSSKGSYWVKGNDNTAFMALYSVKVGKQLHIYKHDSSCYTISKRIKNEGYDSLYAHSGADLINDEFVIYNQDFCTIQYIVQLSN